MFSKELPLRPNVQASREPATTPGVDDHVRLDSLPLASALIDGEGRITATNPIFRTLLAHAHPHHGTAVSALLDRQDRAAFQAMLAAALNEKGSPRNLEISVPLPDGTCRWLMATAAPVSASPTGPAAAFLLQLTDITALKEREADLAERESRWNHALTSSSSRVWDLRLDTGAMYYSDVWRSMRGLGPGEPPPNTEEWLELLHPDDRERVPT